MTRRQKDDFYPTPPDATEALLAYEQFSDDVWEPACGNGAISKVFERHGYDVISTDLNDFGYGTSKRDFLLEHSRLADCVVTNPPYRLADQFICHAINLGVVKHAWLLRLAFLEGQRRYDGLFSLYPPRRVYVFSRRLTLWRGDEEVAGQGTTAYAWFVWEQDFPGPTTVHWI